MTQEEFIKKAREVWGDRFDYSNVNYKNNRDSIEIICPKHGPFYQRPSHHLNKVLGCKECRSESNKEKSESFAKSKIKELYGNNISIPILDNYSTKSGIKFIARCNKHQLDFQTTIHSLVNNHNFCPKCYSELLSTTRSKYNWQEESENIQHLLNLGKSFEEIGGRII